MPSAEPIRLIDDPAHAAAALSPLRLAILDALDAPDSATGLSKRLDLPRQKVNYHLRELESAGLVALDKERRKGNCVERIVKRTAAHYIISPTALGALSDTDGADFQDRFSWSYLVAAAGRILRDLTVLRKRAGAVGKRLPTFTLETEARLASAGALNAMTEEIATAVARIVAKHHDESAPRGRAFRFVLGAYPKITKTEADAAREARRAQQEPTHAQPKDD